MASISYLWRRGARYHYRRRLYLRKIVNRPITVPLATADPAEARRLASRLPKAGELESVFRAALDEAPGLAVASRLDGDMTAGLDHRTLRVLEATYRIAARLPADADSVPSDVIDELTDGLSAQDRAAVVVMLKSLAPQRSAPRTPSMCRANCRHRDRTDDGDARVQLLLARAEAQARATFAGHPLVVRQGDPVAALPSYQPVHLV